MFHIIYRTTNKINSKWYIGYHCTEDLNDDYLGSGKILKRAIKKYGRDQFVREILYVFPTKEEALEKESELITEIQVQDPNCYNSKFGGEGGWDHIHLLYKEKGEWYEKRMKKHSQAMKRSYAEGKEMGWKYTMKGRPNGFLGKKHSKETKKKLSENNGNKLDDSVREQRFKDVKEIGLQYGSIAKLARKWKVSHTQVRRFIKYHITE